MAVLMQLRAARIALRLLCAMLLFVLAPLPVAAQDSAAMQIKAAFLHKFSTYVQGPGTAFEQNATPLVFGVAGSEPVYEFLTELVATQGEGMRAAEVRRVNGPDDLAGVHVLFVGEEAAADADMLLAQGVQYSMLTVSDLPGAQPDASMIHFFVADDRVRFDIALEPASAAGLRLSSRLLQVARRVIAEDQ